MNPEELDRAFVAGNSNPNFVGQLIADFTRKMMQASISAQPYGPTSMASVAFAEILRYLQGFDGEMLREAIAVAEKSLSVDSWGQPDVEAAQSGTSYLIAKSSSDGFSAARASKALSTFRDQMRYALDGHR